jgi:hypothetical protein
MDQKKKKRKKKNLMEVRVDRDPKDKHKLE